MTLPAAAGRIALLGDVHAEHELLEVALDYSEKQSVSQILCVGDIADGPGSVDRCCELLREHQALAVLGNHDRWLLAGTMRNLRNATLADDLADETLAYLNSLPTTRSIPTPVGGALLCHGLGVNDMASVTPDDFGYAIEVNTELHELIADPRISIVFNGHTHQRMVRHFSGLTIVNAGTLHRSHEPGFVILDLSTGAVSWISLRDPSPSNCESLGNVRVLDGAS